MKVVGSESCRQRTIGICSFYLVLGLDFAVVAHDIYGELCGVLTNFSDEIITRQAAVSDFVSGR